MKGQFLIRLPEQEKLIITASVGFISPHDNNQLYVAIRNERGWDIPGGHVEENETPIQAFKRELKEETQCILLPNARPIALLESRTTGNTGIVVYRGFCLVKPFAPTEEILERKIFSTDELIDNYFGDKDIFKILIGLCRQK